MKLQTSIAARRDGTLKVTGQDGQIYEFTKGADGELVGDVTDEATVAHLLAGGQFFPADPADFDAALELTKTASDEDGGDEEEGDDGEEGEADMGAMPIEAETPPAAAPGRKARKAK